MLLLGFIVLLFFIIFLGRKVISRYEVPILMYHSLNPNSNLVTSEKVKLDIFLRQMEFIKRKKYQVISLQEYGKLLEKKNPLPKKGVIITFDDGYKDNLEGIKILRKFNFPATIFVIRNKIGKENYLREEEIKEILKNSEVKIGSHTLDAYLPELDDNRLREEIWGSKRQLEEIFSTEINTISYPLGGFDERVLREVEKAGYLCGCTTNRGFSRKLNRFCLRRIKITNRDVGIKLWVKLTGFYYAFKSIKKPF